MAAAVQTQFAPEAPRGRSTDVQRVFVGVDLGTSMGYAVVDDRGQFVEAGAWNFAPKKGAHAGARFVLASRQISAFLARVIGVEGLRLGGIAYEKVRRHDGVQAAHVYGAFEAILLAVCYQLGIEPDTVEVADLKLVATGKGGGRQATKDHVLVAAKHRWPGFDGDGRGAEDAADAMFCADIMRRRVLGVRF